MSEQEKYSIKKFPSSRRLTSDLGYIGLRKHHIKALIEVDVTRARELIRKYRNTRKEGLSFTAWILRCISQAISEYKQVQAIRKGKDRLVIFDDVDISIVVEKEIQGEKVPLPVVIRKVNEKSLQDIHLEIKAAKEQVVKGEQDYVLGENRREKAMKWFVALPQLLRIFIMKGFLKNPFKVKEMMGTVVVTSVGMMGIVNGWIIPVSYHPLCFALGSIVKKPGVFEHEIQIREFLQMTILIDHDVIDGAPAARFVARLSYLIENGFGL